MADLRGTFDKWMEKARQATAAQEPPAGDPDHPPAGTRVTRHQDPAGATGWKIPASGKSGGLMFFGIFWCLITGIVSAGFLAAFLSADAETGEPGKWFMIPFFAIFWAVGIGILYAAARSKYAGHQIRVDRGTVTLTRVMFGKAKSKSLPLADIRSVARVEFYQKNYTPVHGIEIRGTTGKLRFGSMLAEEEKAWLVADIRRAVFGEPALAPEAALARQSHFSFPVPAAPAGSLIGIAAFMAVATLFIILGLTVFNSDKSFLRVWLGLNSLFLILGIAAFVTHLKGRGTETTIEGNELNVSIRTTKNGRILKDRSFPRASVSELRSSPGGILNGRPMKRLDLIVDGKSHKISWWTESVEAEILAAQVRAVLGK